MPAPCWTIPAKVIIRSGVHLNTCMILKVAFKLNSSPISGFCNPYAFEVPYYYGSRKIGWFSLVSARFSVSGISCWYPSTVCKHSAEPARRRGVCQVFTVCLNFQVASFLIVLWLLPTSPLFPFRFSSGLYPTSHCWLAWYIPVTKDGMNNSPGNNRCETFPVSCPEELFSVPACPSRTDCFGCCKNSLSSC